MAGLYHSRDLPAIHQNLSQVQDQNDPSRFLVVPKALTLLGDFFRSFQAAGKSRSQRCLGEGLKRSGEPRRRSRRRQHGAKRIASTSLNQSSSRREPWLHWLGEHCTLPGHIVLQGLILKDRVQHTHHKSEAQQVSIGVGKPQPGNALHSAAFSHCQKTKD